MELKLETRNQDDKTEQVGPALISPITDEDYWSYRVRLSERQAVVGFSKFSTIGIGFAIEDTDWNTNLPWTSPTKRIVDHIWCNVGDESITRADVTRAVAMIQDAVKNA